MEETKREDTCDVLLKNSFVSEMALRNLRDFKSRSRSNVVPRVAKRINLHERRFKDKMSTMTSVAAEPKRSKANKSVTTQKVMSYTEIKKWHQWYNLDGKSVYQLDAEFTSLVKMQVEEL